MNEEKITNVEFVCKETGTLIRGRFIIPSTEKSKLPLVIMLTGDGPKGTKSLSWVNIPPKLCELGIASFLFDFEGLGYSDGNRKLLTITKGIANFISAFDYIKSIEWIDSNRIAIFASSFGANAALLCPSIINSCKVIGLKSPSCFLPDAYLNEIGHSNLEKWISDGYLAENGYGKMTKLDEYKTQGRGGSGIKTVNVTPKTGKLIVAKVIVDEEAEMLAISKNSQVIKTEVKTIPTLGRATQGVRIMKLRDGDSVASLAIL